MGAIKKIMKNDYVFSLLNKMMAVAVGIITSSLTNRYLGPALKGEYAYVINIVNIVVIIGNFGFYQSYPLNKRKNMNNQMKVYVDAFFAQFFIYLIIAVIFSFYTNGNAFYISAIVLVPIQVLTQQLALIALVEFIRFSQKLQIAMLFVNLFLIVSVYLFAPQNVIYISIVFILKDLLFIVCYLFKIRCIPNPFNIEFQFIKYLCRFGTFAMLSALLVNLNYKIDVLILRRYVDFTSLGLYSTGVALAEYAWLIPDAFKDVLFSRTAKDDSIGELVRVIKLNIIITVIIILSVFLFGKLFISILYGIEFINAYSITVIIFLGVPSMVLYKLIGPLYLANGRQKFYFSTLLISVIANIIVSFLAIPHFGTHGAAIGSVLSYTICGVLFYADFVKKYNIRWFDIFLITKEDIRDFSKIIFRWSDH